MILQNWQYWRYVWFLKPIQTAYVDRADDGTLHIPISAHVLRVLNGRNKYLGSN